MYLANASETRTGSGAHQFCVPDNANGNRRAISRTPDAYWCRLGQAPLEVDPVAHPQVGEPGSARYGQSSMTCCTVKGQRISGAASSAASGGVLGVVLGAGALLGGTRPEDISAHTYLFEASSKFR